MILRRCQVVEFHYEKKMRAQMSKDSTPGVTRDEAADLSGTHSIAGEVMISPELVEWVSKDIGRDVEATKQLRKAREEAKLACQNG